MCHLSRNRVTRTAMFTSIVFVSFVLILVLRRTVERDFLKKKGTNIAVVEYNVYFITKS